MNSLIVIFVVTLAGNTIASKIIVGGESVAIEDFPYQVGLFEGRSFSCGGSIISKSYVLTAAHCVKNRWYNYYVRAGTHLTYSGGSLHKVIKMVIHDEYVNQTEEFSRDIALLKVDPPFTFDKTRQPVKLFQSNDTVKTNDIVTVSGYGKISENNFGASDKLKAVSLPVLDRRVCEKGFVSFDEYMEKDIFCAGYMSGGKDHCYGDSGGPGVIGGKQAGIVYWGVGCATPGAPGTYVSVAYYNEWIRKNMDEILA